MQCAAWSGNSDGGQFREPTPRFWRVPGGGGLSNVLMPVLPPLGTAGASSYWEEHPLPEFARMGDPAPHPKGDETCHWPTGRGLQAGSTLWVSRTPRDHQDWPSVDTGPPMEEIPWSTRGLWPGWGPRESGGAAASWARAGRSRQLAQCVRHAGNKVVGRTPKTPLPASQVRATPWQRLDVQTAGMKRELCVAPSGPGQPCWVGADLPAALGPRPWAQLQTLPVKEPSLAFPSSGHPATSPNSKASSSSLRAILRQRQKKRGEQRHQSPGESCRPRASPNRTLPSNAVASDAQSCTRVREHLRACARAYNKKTLA